MKVNVSEALKTASVKENAKNKVDKKVDKKSDENFLDSLNKFLKKNNFKKGKSDKKLGKVNKEKKNEESEEITQTNREHLSIDHLISFLKDNSHTKSQDNSLNLEVPLEMIGEKNNQTKLLTVSEILMTKDLNNLSLHEGVEGQESTLFQEQLSFQENFNVEEAKANLNKALSIEETEKGVEVKIEELLEKTGKDNLTSKESLAGKVVLETSLEEASKEEGVLGADKLFEKTGKDNLTSKESLELETFLETSKAEQGVDSINLESLKSKEKDIVEEVEGKTEPQVELNLDSVEKDEALNSNFILNRIQNSFLNLDEIGDKLSLENLEGVENSIIKFMKVSKEGDTSTMRVKLYPEELGSMDISLKLSEGKLIADIVVESEKIKALFLNSSNLLNRNLLEQNIPIKDINVWVNDSFNSLENFNGQEDHGQGRGENPQRQNLNRGLKEDLNLNPLDNVRINKVNHESKSLNILV